MADGTIFYAYPGTPPMVRDAIRGLALEDAPEGLNVKTWEKLNVLGFQIDQLIREKISEADLIAADVTYPNLNVFYEIGYAIASGKPVLPTVNIATARATDTVRKVGLLDTTGYATYSNSNDLMAQLAQWEGQSWKRNFFPKRNFAQPLFVLDTQLKTDFRNWIFHAIEESELKYRVFDPAEVPRLTAAQAFTEVSSSAGVIIPLLSKEVVDSEMHNIRAGFTLGLAHGCGIEALVLQYENEPAPLDYRDFVRNSTSRIETLRHVVEYCHETLVRNQSPSTRAKTAKESIISRIDLGSSFAENESTYLNQYFVETAEFSRALRTEGAIVTGRKGSGKSAIFLQVLETLQAKSSKNCVVDLRPASHELSEMREELMSVMSAGVFDHTVAAFWQYVIYYEILLKLREVAIPRTKNDFGAQKKIAELEEKFKLSDQIVSGDFTSRLKTAVETVVEKVRATPDKSNLRSELTNFMFEAPIPSLRDAIVDLSSNSASIHVLLDDLDKGWPPLRVESQDVMMVKHLIESLGKIRKELGRRGVNFSHLLFLRGDIYERLVERTSDRGKYNVINVDWSDPLQLVNLIRTRVSTSVEEGEEDEAWQAMNPMMGERDAISTMITASLMRPRFLIDVCERALSFAINRGHSSVSANDVSDAIHQMSLYLVSDFGYEMRDVAGTPEDIFYLFIGSDSELSSFEVEDRLSQIELSILLPETIDLLLWYGFLGIVDPEGKPVFIYDRAYDFRRLEAERRSRGDDLKYALNPAFLSGLN